MKKNLRGTAYIEILIATLIITAYAVPLYSVLGRIDGIQSKIEQRALARAFLESSVSSFRATPRDQRIPATTTSSVDILPSGQLVTTVTEHDSAQPSLLQYSATLIWQSTGGTQTMHIATYINNGG